MFSVFENPVTFCLHFLCSVEPNTNLLVLNEVVIDRGPSPYLSNIDLYLDGKLITSVQGNIFVIYIIYIYSVKCLFCIDSHEIEIMFV